MSWASWCTYALLRPFTFHSMQQRSIHPYARQPTDQSVSPFIRSCHSGTDDNLGKLCSTSTLIQLTGYSDTNEARRRGTPKLSRGKSYDRPTNEPGRSSGPTNGTINQICPDDSPRKSKDRRRAAQLELHAQVGSLAHSPGKYGQLGSHYLKAHKQQSNCT